MGRYKLQKLPIPGMNLFTGTRWFHCGQMLHRIGVCQPNHQTEIDHATYVSTGI